MLHPTQDLINDGNNSINWIYISKIDRLGKVLYFFDYFSGISKWYRLWNWCVNLWEKQYTQDKASLSGNFFLKFIYGFKKINNMYIPVCIIQIYTGRQFNIEKVVFMTNPFCVYKKSAFSKTWITVSYLTSVSSNQICLNTLIIMSWYSSELSDR